MKKISIYIALCAVFLVATFTMLTSAYSAAGGSPAKGASLYEACVPCHTYTGNGIAGLPVDTLINKMTEYQSIKTNNPKIQGMQKALKPMSEQDLEDLADYISKM